MEQIAASANLDPDVPIEGGGEGGPLPNIPDAPSEKELEDGLRALSQSWISKLKTAQKHKKPFKVCPELYQGPGCTCDP